MEFLYMEINSILPFNRQMVNGLGKKIDKRAKKIKKHIDILSKGVHNKETVSKFRRYSFDQIIRFSVVPPISGRDFRERWMKGKMEVVRLF